MTPNLLMLCTRDSARSMLGEAMLNHLAAGLGRRVRTCSAQSGRINPEALRRLHDTGIDTAGLRSNGREKLTGPQAPPPHMVVTVCDSAPAEARPIFRHDAGRPSADVHWVYADPSDAEGGKPGKRRTPELSQQALGYRMLERLQLGLDAIDAASVRRALDTIARS